MDLEQLKYPIGKVEIPTTISQKDIDKWISDIERFPHELEFLVRDLSDNQLDTPYRKGGWSVRQVIHHCFDSHTNSYIRFKWALTEDTPLIKAYFEDKWAEIEDSKSSPIFLSIDGLKALHSKWVYLLKGLSKIDLEKYFVHPETKEKVSLKENIGIYAWHCQHHYAHIEQLMIREHWR